MKIKQLSLMTSAAALLVGFLAPVQASQVPPSLTDSCASTAGSCTARISSVAKPLLVKASITVKSGGPAVGKALLTVKQGKTTIHTGVFSGTFTKVINPSATDAASPVKNTYSATVVDKSAPTNPTVVSYSSVVKASVSVPL